MCIRQNATGSDVSLVRVRKNLIGKAEKHELSNPSGMNTKRVSTDLFFTLRRSGSFASTEIILIEELRDIRYLIGFIGRTTGP
jgi:hypothetical protein